MIHKISPLPGYDGVGSPRWSPDGKRLAYDSRGDGRYRIILADLNTGDRHVLTTEPMDGARPSWSRDGRWIYFSSTREGFRQNLENARRRRPSHSSYKERRGRRIRV